MSYSSDVAFTPAVKAVQARKGSRASYARQEQAGSWKTRITSDLKIFIEAQTSVFLATANAKGQPYIQHRGGPPGFLRVLDEATLGFADFVGNRQYITLGNLAENPKAHLFLIDYAHRKRVKVWCQAILFKVLAWDANCPQHIPQRLEAADVATALAERDRRIAELEAQMALLRAAGEQ
jgi:predicted pyridoxine 5'-phosphate oxidase superfamily flavin-nucleotide-binding protein